MQKQSKNAAIVCLIISPFVVLLGIRIGALCNPNDLFKSLGPAIDGVWSDILINPFYFIPNKCSLILAVALLLAVWLVWLVIFGMDRPEMVGAEHGSSRWATKSEIKKFANNDNPDCNIVLSNSAALAVKRDGFSLKYDRNLNIAVIGGSGSGKTRYYVKPNLMQLHGNYFVTDPKGTVIEDCGDMLRNNGYEVKCFNVIPDTMDKSMCFNPLYYVKTKEQLLSFVNCLIKNTTPKNANTNDPFWEKSETLLYVSVLSLMQDWLADEEYTLPNLLHYIGLAQAKEEDEDWESPLDLIFKEIETGYMYVKTNSAEALMYADITGQIIDKKTNMKNRVVVHGSDGEGFSIVGAENSIAKLKPREGHICVPSDIEDKNTGKSPWELFVETNGLTLPEERKDDFSVLRYKEFKAAAGKTLKSIIISCNSRLMPVAIPQIAKILSGRVEKKQYFDSKTKRIEIKEIETGECEMHLDELGDADKKTCIFAVMSDTNDTYFFLVALMMYQVIDLLCSKALTAYGGKLPRFVHFIFDEFANLGVLKDFERTIAITRSRNIGISLILQTPFQLKSSYDENAAKTILDNCDSTVYLGGGNDGADVSTCKEISARLGKKTIHTRTSNISKGSNRNFTQNNAIQQRELMMPDEVSRLPRDESIVLIKNTFPFRDKKVILENRARYKELKD